MAMACLGDVSCLGAEDEDALLVSKKGDLEAGEKMVEMHDIKVKPEAVKDYTEEQLSEPHGVAKPFMLEAVVSTMTELIVDKGPEDPELVKERHRHRFDGNEERVRRARGRREGRRPRRELRRAHQGRAELHPEGLRQDPAARRLRDARHGGGQGRAPRQGRRALVDGAPRSMGADMLPIS